MAKWVAERGVLLSWPLKEVDSLSFTLSAHVRSVITQPFDSRVTASSDNWFEAVARLLTDYLDTRQTMNRYKKNNTVNM